MITIVGEQNPYRGDDYYALYPSPTGCAGYRLCTVILGMQRVDYLEAFKRINLVIGPWSAKLAKAKAIEVLAATEPGDRLILCGSKVAKAFGLIYEPFTVLNASAATDTCDSVVVILPHPSGMCRLWNNPGSVQEARRAVMRAAPEIAHLIGTLGV